MAYNEIPPPAFSMYRPIEPTLGKSSVFSNQWELFIAGHIGVPAQATVGNRKRLPALSLNLIRNFLTELYFFYISHKTISPLHYIGIPQKQDSYSSWYIPQCYNPYPLPDTPTYTQPFPASPAGVPPPSRWRCRQSGGW